MKTISVKKLAAMTFVAVFFITFILIPILAGAETLETARTEELASTALSEGIVADGTAQDPPIEPWTWAYLATIAGATAATLLIAQFLKVPLDVVWKIPTRLFVYAISLVIMTIATAFTSGLTVNNFLLAVLNAFIVAFAAYGSYEVTFAKRDAAKKNLT